MGNPLSFLKSSLKNNFSQYSDPTYSSDPSGVHHVYVREQSFAFNLNNISLFVKSKWILLLSVFVVLTGTGSVITLSQTINSASEEVKLEQTKPDFTSILKEIEKKDTNNNSFKEETSANAFLNGSTPTPTLTPSPSPTPAPTITPTPSPTPTLTPTTAPTPTSGPPGTEYSNMIIATERGNFSIDVITIDMNGTKMITDTGNDDNCGNDCSTKSLSNYISTHGAFAGINGTYFCPPDYSECASKKNSFDFPVYNPRLNKWINQWNLSWNDRSMIYQDQNGLHFLKNAKDAWSNDMWGVWFNPTTSHPDAAVVNSPGLLENGNVIADQYPLNDKQKGKGTKGGLGFNGNKVYLVIARNVGMVDFGYIFKALGASYALNLDGGGSSALWYGKYRVGPGRSLPNAIVFTK